MFRASLLLFLLGGGLAARADPPARVFSHPERIRYDGQCLTIDGRDVLVFSGTFPYFRCPRPLWRDRFAGFKAAGCNAVDTDVPVDPSPEELTGLQEWLRLAHDAFGLYTIVRPGSGVATESWLKAVGPVIAAEQVTRRPPGRGGVILFQIENGDDRPRGISGSDPEAGLRPLAAAAVADGIEVPIFTEGSQEARDRADPLRAIQDGATILTTGDDGPAAQAIGLMLQRHGAALARSRAIACDAEIGDPEVTVAARRARNGDTYVFFRNQAADRPHRGTAAVWLEHAGETDVAYTLRPLGCEILFLPKGEKDASRGEWLPRPVRAEIRPSPHSGP